MTPLKGRIELLRRLLEKERGAAAAERSAVAPKGCVLWLRAWHAYKVTSIPENAQHHPF
jgi:hypothetical protein